MNSYLLPHLTSAQVDGLRQAGLTIHIFDQAQQSYLVTEAQLGDALALLGASGSQSATQYQDIFELDLTYDSAPADSSVEQGSVSGCNDSSGARPRAADLSAEEKAKLENDRLRSRRNYIDACSERIRELVKGTRKELAKVNRQLSAAKQRVFDLHRCDAFGRRAVAASDWAKEQTKFSDQFADQFDCLTAVSHVKSVTARHSLIMIKTDPLFARHDQSGEMHEIGAFLIVIDLCDGTAPVRWFNSSRRVDGLNSGMNAPNVFADGTPLVDEIEETMVELVARIELSVVADLAVQFIENVNGEAAGRHLENWPRTRV